MKPTHHLLISAALSILLLIWFKSWHAALACLLGGVFIDLDHHLDYFIDKKKIPLSYQELFDFGAHGTESKLYLFLHSYELLTLFWLLIWYLHLNDIWIGLALGFSVHMICDQIVNPVRPLGYFLIYRMKYGFERKHIFTKEYFETLV